MLDRFVAAGVRDAASPDAVIAAALDALIAVAGDGFAALHVRSDDGAWLSLRGERDLGRLGDVAHRVRAGGGPLGVVVTTGAPFSAAKAPDDHGLVAATPGRAGGVAKIHALLVVPVSRGARALGTLALGRLAPGAFQEADRVVVEVVAAALAPALERPAPKAAGAAPARSERALAQLRRVGRLAAVGDLAGSVAHEANNPLTTVLGHSQLLSTRADIPQAAADRLGVVAGEAARAAQVLQQLLIFSREYPPERRACALVTLVQQVLDVAAYQLRHDAIRVETELGDCPPVSADESQLRQVLLALLQGARHAAREQSTGRALTVRTGRRDGAAFVEVHHTGAPALGEGDEAAVDLEPLLERTAAGAELFAASLIVAEHGGRLRCTGRPGGGGIIAVELPAASPTS